MKTVSRVEKSYNLIASLLLVLLFTVGLNFQGLFGQIGLLLCAFSIIYVAVIWKKISFTKAEKAFIYASFIFPLSVLLSMAIHGEIEGKHFDNPSRLFLVLPVYIAFKYSSIKIDVLHWAILIGSIFVGSIAIYQGHVLGFVRVYGYISDVNSPISFGNMGLMLGLLSSLSYPSIIKVFPRFGYVLVFAAFAFGAYASILSGTRGGWVSLPFIFIGLLAIFNKSGIVRNGVYVLGFMLLLLSVYWFLPQVTIRIDRAIDHLYSYMFLDGMPGGSVVSRLEMWKAAILLSKEAPFLGVGLGKYFTYKKELIESGLVWQHIGHYRYAHNEPLHYLSEMGLLGFIPLVLFYWAGFNLCWSHLERKEVKLIASMGLMISIFRFDISLTQVQFVYHFTTLFYALLFAIIVGFMCRGNSASSKRFGAKQHT